MLEQVVPDAIVTVEQFHYGSHLPAFREERDQVATAVPRRQAEFAAGRTCAHAALRRLGAPEVPLLRGPHGAPRWPAGFLGSITHTDDYCAAAVATDDDCVSIGVDAEPDAALPEGVLPLISLEPERAAIGLLRSTTPGTHWDRLLFCAKEAVFKAWFPLTQRWLGFEEAHVTLSPHGTFDAELAAPLRTARAGDLSRLSGRWLSREGLIVTAVVVEPTARA
jgi:4'-phosphopantetheinyl transferase EntD